MRGMANFRIPLRALFALSVAAGLYALVGFFSQSASALNWQCPCPGMSKDSGMSADGPPPNCQTVCFGTQGGGPDIDYQAQQAEQAAERRAKQDVERQAEAARRAEEAARRAAFLRDRDATPLKGTSPPSDTGGLKGVDAAGAELKGIGSPTKPTIKPADL